MRFFLDGKTGFVCSDRIITISDKDGKLFLVIENPILEEKRFNLPSGEYLTNNKLIEIEPVNYKTHRVPNPNFKKPLPKDFDVFFINNPNKCSVDTSGEIGKVYFDNSFKKYPEYFLTYVKYHELGHYFFSGKKNKSEKDCDHFAVNEMIKDGYNPEQIKFAINNILSNRPDALERKKYINKVFI